MNFTGTYKEQKFYEGENVSWVDVQEAQAVTAIVMMRQRKHWRTLSESFRQREYTFWTLEIITT